MKVAVTGATGFVGSRLVERLQAEGHDVLVLSRDGDHARKVFPTDAFPRVEVLTYTPLESGDWQQSISGCQGVVNLAGAPIAERWSDAHKRAIIDSRQVGTQKIVEAIAKADVKPSVLVNSSAIGYYGTSETATFDETTDPVDPDDFLSKVCQAWEAAAHKAAASGTRVVILRTGIVLGMGGAIAKMLPPFRMFAGGPIGSGKQWFSWIHRDDLVNLMLKALIDGQMQGVYNATSPNPLRMGEFCQVLGEVMNRPSWLPVPDFVLETLLGDGAQVVLEGQQVLPKRTQTTGFEYQYPNAKTALQDILS